MPLYWVDPVCLLRSGPSGRAHLVLVCDGQGQGRAGAAAGRAHAAMGRKAPRQCRGEPSISVELNDPQARLNLRPRLPEPTA